MQTKESFLKGRSVGFLIGLLRHQKFYPCSPLCPRCLSHRESIDDAIISQTGEIDSYLVFDKCSGLHFKFNKAEIKAELAKRPHLTSKRERKRKKK